MPSPDPRAVELVAKEAKRRHRSFEAPGGHLGGTAADHPRCLCDKGWLVTLVRDVCICLQEENLR